MNECWFIYEYPHAGFYSGGWARAYVLKVDGEIITFEMPMDNIYYYRLEDGGMLIIRKNEIEYRPGYHDFKVASIIFKKDSTFSLILRKDKKAPKPVFPDIRHYESMMKSTGNQRTYHIDQLPEINVPQLDTYEEYQNVELEVDYETILTSLS